MALTPEEQERITRDAIMGIDYSNRSKEKQDYYAAIRNDMDAAKFIAKKKGMGDITFEMDCD